MKSAVFSLKSDAKLIPPLMHNVYMRNGIFYFRKMINGKRILKSLHTNNPLLAQYLAFELSTEQLIKRAANNLVSTTNLLPKNQNMIKTEKANEPKTKGHQMENLQPGNGHLIIDIWNTQVEHGFNKTNQQTADTRVDTMLKMLGCETIEELDADPKHIDQLKKGLLDYVQPTGKNKGQKYTIKTVREHLRLMRQIIATADNEYNLQNTSKIITKLRLLNTPAVKDLSDTKNRVPFDEEDYKKLFECMLKVKNNDLSDLCAMYQTYTDQNDKFLIERLYTYPKQWYFAILLALYTGARANMVITLRHQDIDLTNNTINFHVNKSLTKHGDIREKQKRVKTRESDRVVPIASILLNDLGLKDYLIQHEAKYGKPAFIFEEFITTETGYKDSYLNQAVNKLFSQLGIKPSKDSKVLKDFHSLKKCFYSCNLENVGGLEVLEALAGNKPSNNSVAARCYAQLSMDTAKSVLTNAVERISYPHIDILVSKKKTNDKTRSGNGAIMYSTPTTPAEERANPNNPLNDPVLRKKISVVIGKSVRGMTVYNNSATFFFEPHL